MVMKAVIWTKYGPPEGLIMEEVEKPVPKDDEILIKVFAASVTAGDCEFRRLELPLSLSFPMRLYAGWKKPARLRILGQELAGEVVETGKDVSAYKVGDQVFGTTGMGFGAYAEYLCLPAEPGDTQGILAIKPDNLSFEEAAVIPTAGMEALHYIGKARLTIGSKVLIIGAGGSIGTLAIQLANNSGAEVTAVDSGDKLELLRELGAQRVIDYANEDFTKIKERFDLIIDVVGKKSVYKRIKLLKKNGFYFLAYAGLRHIFLGIWTGLFLKRKLRIESSEQSKNELLSLKDLIEREQMKPVIDKTYALAQTAEAHRYSESGSKKGNVALKIKD